jgi:hypothetical protein
VLSVNQPSNAQVFNDSLQDPNCMFLGFLFVRLCWKYRNLRLVVYP